ncbi:GTP-binding protein Era [Nitzschia inconspicua]|uniref:GTP-binding protein Era n=1 Tax=Nitzschia inconspicua TaxID=303405 RepID=A0A9K3LLC3_9STRA|nr:GTP-binding protein Era [Nitzschia inconspicua]
MIIGLAMSFYGHGSRAVTIAALVLCLMTFKSGERDDAVQYSVGAFSTTTTRTTRLLQNNLERNDKRIRIQILALHMSDQSPAKNKPQRKKNNDDLPKNISKSNSKSRSNSSYKSPEKQTRTTPINNDGEPSMSGRSLLQQLDSTFDYEGRLPSQVHKQDFRCGYVGILGAPNMGKSTLLNALLEENLCIATRRPQTTRHAIMGVLTTANSQLCLIDTPGIIQDPAYKLQEGMMEAVQGTFQDSDAFLVVTDLFSTPIPDDEIFEKLTRTKKPIVVAINKIDLEGQAKIPTRKDSARDDGGDSVVDDKTYSLVEAVAKWRRLLPNALAIVPVSAVEGVSNPGVDLLRMILVGEGDIPSAIRNMGRPIAGMFRNNQQFLSNEDAKALLPLGPPLYEQDVLTDRSERFFCAELIRESLFECLNKEVPYCCEVQVYYFKEPRGKQKRVIDIRAYIYVERESQKGIVVGKGGQQLKEVGIMARGKIERFLGEPVSLNLSVAVKKDWRKNEDELKRFGYMRQ